jgi:outer membrane protein TolC
MLSANRQLTRARNLVTIARLQTQEVKAEKLPVVGATAAYSYSKQSSEAGFLLSNQVNGLNYGFTIRLNVFDGGNINRRIQNSRMLEDISEAELEQTQLTVVRDLENIYLEYVNNLQLVKLEQRNLEVALESVEIAVDRYRFGSSSFIELRDAQINAVRAYGRLLSATYNTKVAETELLRLSGRLVSDLN